VLAHERTGDFELTLAIQNWTPGMSPCAQSSSRYVLVSATDSEMWSPPQMPDGSRDGPVVAPPQA
jgi:hypothetical protein